MKSSSVPLFLSAFASCLLALTLTAQRLPDGQGFPAHPVPPPALRDVPSNGLAMTPPMGWNSWNKFEGKVDDKAVREIADAMVKNGMKAAGYVYVNIDDTWQGQRDAQGNIQANSKFPDMKALADYVHSKGLKIGIYSSPGPQTCAHYEGSYGHEQQDARTYAAWGFDYLKYDWCSAGKLYPHDAETLQAVYQKMGDALQQSGRPILFSLCEYGLGDVWKWAPKVSGNAWRTTGDISDSWASMSKIGFQQNELAPWAGPGHWNDPDMLEVGNGGMNDTEYQTHFSLWSMLAAPLLAGNDLRTVSPDILKILTNRDVIAIDQDPLGKQATRAWKSGEQEVWTRPLQNGDIAVAFFNRGAASAKISVKWQDIGIDHKPKHARDLWRHKSVRLRGAEYRATVPSHGVELLRLKK
jgi:alpha-galactosidase